MRIISGKYKGKRIPLPSNYKARPTTDFAKEGLFDILHHRVNWNELEILDLFSGTGYISYEFASRGVKHVTAIEIEPLHVNFIKKTTDQLQLPITVIKGNVFNFIQKPAKKQFDIIFCDPPYTLEISTIPNLIFENGFLKDDGLLIIEHEKKKTFIAHPYFLHQRSYGKVQFSFFSKNAEKYFFK